MDRRGQPQGPFTSAWGEPPGNRQPLPSKASKIVGSASAPLLCPARHAKDIVPISRSYLRSSSLGCLRTAPLGRCRRRSIPPGRAGGPTSSCLVLWRVHRLPVLRCGVRVHPLHRHLLRPRVTACGSGVGPCPAEGPTGRPPARVAGAGPFAHDLTCHRLFDVVPVVTATVDSEPRSLGALPSCGSTGRGGARSPWLGRAGGAPYWRRHAVWPRWWNRRRGTPPRPGPNSFCFRPLTQMSATEPVRKETRRATVVRDHIAGTRCSD